MIIDEKGKFFGKVSIVDVVIVLFVIVVAAVLGWRFVGANDAAKKVQEITCRYECVVDNIRIESVNELKNNIGKAVCDARGNTIGTLVSVTERPYEEEMITERGNVILAEVPQKYSADIVFEGECKKVDSGYVSGEGYEISIGSKPMLTMRTIDVETQVINITELN